MTRGSTTSSVAPIKLYANHEDYVRNNPTPAEVRARLFKGLCFQCQMIFATWREPNDGLFDIPKHERKEAHHNFEDLDNCWCPLCKMLRWDLRRYSEEAQQVLRIPKNRIKTSDVRVYKTVRHVPCYHVELVFNFDDWRLLPYFNMFVAGSRGSSVTGTIQPATDCESTWNLVNSWLRTCQDHHDKRCHMNHLVRTLPTRLLYIGTIHSARLIMTNSLPLDTPYATLSHCWGSKSFLKLTRENFESFLAGMPLECLSKTFRDAIKAARKLGFQYLWIDSLCIIQEDEDDWRCEASSMSRVYSNSSLNLAAADSPDSNIGLFFDNRCGVPSGWKVTFPSPGLAPLNTMAGDFDDDSPSKKQFTWNCIAFKTKEVMDYSHLASRAWTLQERLLPPRTVYFGREQISWECRDCNAYEALPDMFSEGSIRFSPGNFAALLSDPMPLASEHGVRQWSDIVENYSKRSLTVSKDKLVAISGLARILAPVYGGTPYAAGLWVKDLIRLLGWHPYTPEPQAESNEETAYRAPSWSWASVNSRVTFPNSGFCNPLDGEYANDAKEARYPALAKVLEAVTTFPGDEFGEVIGGFIRLRVQALYRVIIDTTKWLHDRHFPVEILGLGTIKQFTAWPDHSLESIEGESLLLPLMDGMRDYPYDYPEMRGLFLEHVEYGVYRRKGAWRLGGEYSNEGFADINKATDFWMAKGADRIANRSAAGLDEDEFRGLWDGQAYVVKII